MKIAKIVENITNGTYLPFSHPHQALRVGRVWILHLGTPQRVYKQFGRTFDRYSRQWKTLCLLLIRICYLDLSKIVQFSSRVPNNLAREYASTASSDSQYPVLSFSSTRLFCSFHFNLADPLSSYQKTRGPQESNRLLEEWSSLRHYSSNQFFGRDLCSCPRTQSDLPRYHWRCTGFEVPRSSFFRATPFVCRQSSWWLEKLLCWQYWNKSNDSHMQVWRL